MKFTMGKVNPIKAILTGKLKLRGIKKILQFVKYFKVLSYLQKQKDGATKAETPAAPSTSPKP